MNKLLGSGDLVAGTHRAGFHGFGPVGEIILPERSQRIRCTHALAYLGLLFELLKA